MAKKKRKKYPELNALKGLIREKGASYRRIADEIGMGTNTLSNKINGYFAFTGDEMQQIATILGIDPKDITYFFLPSYCETHQKAN